MDEFSLIKKYLAPLSEGCKGAFSLTDDAAVIGVSDGYEAVVTKDAIVENVHFPSGTSPEKIIKKLVRVNLSDIAAMGAVPKYYLIAAFLPKDLDKGWFKKSASALLEEQQEYGISLIGGDTVSHEGGIELSLTMIGEVQSGKAIRRTTANEEDDLYVSGTIGDAALGLLAYKGDLTDLGNESKNYLLSRYELPQPRTPLGKKLVNIASAAADISDGFLADLLHMRVGCVIEKNAIPLSDAAQEALKDSPELLDIILTGGDDYELLFTAPKGKEGIIADISKDISVPITKIGKVISKSDTKILDTDGTEIVFNNEGFAHF